jgi:hypothetical protein
MYAACCCLFHFFSIFRVTLPSAVQLLICAPTNGGKLKQKCVHSPIYFKPVVKMRKCRLFIQNVVSNRKCRPYFLSVLSSHGIERKFTLILGVRILDIL